MSNTERSNNEANKKRYANAYLKRRRQQWLYAKEGSSDNVYKIDDRVVCDDCSCPCWK